MGKPSQTLRRTRRRARAWKQSARQWRAVALTYQTLLKSHHQIDFLKNVEHMKELQARGLYPIPDSICSSCGKVQKTNRSMATKELYVRRHLAVDHHGFCFGSYKAPRKA